MSRHRDVRKLNYNEYGLDYDEYGRSVEDDAPISPTDARQWLFDRERGQQSVSSFIANHRDIEEEDEEECEPQRRDSESFEPPPLTDDDRAKLESCIDEIRNVIGDAASDRQMTETVLNNNFDLEKSLADILNQMSQKQEPQLKVTEKKEAIQKDFCNSSTVERNPGVTAECLPKAFNKLAEFANFHLTNRPTVASTAATENPKFKIPKFSIKDPSAKSTFIIPKLGGASKVDDSKNRIETPHELSMQKIMALKELNLSSNSKSAESIPPNCQTVDLSTALRTGVNAPILVPHKIPTDDNFQPKFIDCDILTGYLPTITQDCEIDVSHVLARNCRKYRTRNYSKFGKIICSKFRARAVPYVDHDFRQRHAIEAFGFLTPSPCDLILKHVAVNLHR